VTEAEEQAIIVTYFRARFPKFARSLRVSQSGGFKGKGRQGAIRMGQIKAQGGVKGEADIAILLPRHGFGCLLIEHKAAGSSHKATIEQLEYVTYHNENGNLAVVTRGVEAAVAAINTYLGVNRGEISIQDLIDQQGEMT